MVFKLPLCPENITRRDGGWMDGRRPQAAPGLAQNRLTSTPSLLDLMHPPHHRFHSFFSQSSGLKKKCNVTGGTQRLPNTWVLLNKR